MFGCMAFRGGLTRTAIISPVLFLILAGCGAEPTVSGSGSTPTGTPSATTEATPVDDLHCLKAGEQVTRFPGGDGTLPGVLLGTGTVGIIFGHQTDGGICQWIETAREFAAKGYRTLVFDFDGYGLARSTRSATITADVVSASEYLKTVGVTRIALVGASMGGAGVVTASVKVSLPVAAVVSLSGSNALRTDAEPVAAAAQLKAPLLCVAAKRDQGGAFATVATGMCPANAPGPRQLFLMDGSDHGVVLYQNQSAVKSTVDAFLAQYAPPTGAAG
jgi:dienelactone hydrolase